MARLDYFRFTLLALGLTTASSSFAVVGYYNLTVFPGDNLIANQLNTTNNSLNNLINSGSSFPHIPTGSTFTKWNPVANQYLPASVYNAVANSWTLNYGFDLTEGGLLHVPIAFTNTFVGEVSSTYFDAGTLSFNYTNYPHYANGFYLLSCPVPFSGAGFKEVVGRDPLDGEWVKTLDPVSQIYTTTTYDDLSEAWDHGAPALGVGESAFFNLGPVAVPEPSTCVLALSAAVSLGYFRNRKSAKA